MAHHPTNNVQNRKEQLCVVSASHMKWRNSTGVSLSGN